MTSILKVTEIQDPTNSNTALEIDSSGRVTHPQKPYVFVAIEQGTAGWLAHASNDAIKFNTVIEGDSNLFDTSTHKFTCPVGGLYLITYSIHSNSTAFQTQVMRNTTQMQVGYQGDSDTEQASLVVDCDANDELYVRSYGAAENYYAGSGTALTRYTYATFTLIG